MKLSGVYHLGLPRERAYQILQDPDVLARCMPGCEGLERIGDNEYRMKMKMALAAFSGLFEGKVKIVDQEPHDRFRLLVDGTGKVGFMQGEGLLRLISKDEGTEVSYEGDVQVGGTIAAVGQRLIDSTARMMIKRFFDKLAAEAKESG